MIELRGIGVPDGHGGWLLHRVCTRMGSGRLVAVLSTREEERRALLDAVGGRRLAEEGRAWVAGVPVTAQTMGRLRSLVVEVDLGAGGIALQRSALWNTLTAAGSRRGRVAGLLRLPRAGDRTAAYRALEAVGLAAHADLTAAVLDRTGRALLALAGALTRQPEILVVHDLDTALAASAPGFLQRLRTIAGARRVLVLASLNSLGLAQQFADRVLVVADGALVLDGPPEAVGGDRARGRLAALATVLR